MRIPQNLIVDLASSAAGDAARVGPKAANLAALARAGLPTPGGFCLTAAAYRLQIARLGLTAGVEDMHERPSATSAGSPSTFASSCTRGRSRPRFSSLFSQRGRRSGKSRARLASCALRR